MPRLGPYDDRPLQHMQLEARVKELEAKVKELERLLGSESEDSAVFPAATGRGAGASPRQELFLGCQPDGVAVKRTGRT